MMSRALGCVLVVGVLAGCGSSPPTAPQTPPSNVAASNQIIGTRAEGTAKELLAKGEKALLSQQWQEAVDAFEAVLAGDTAAGSDPQVLYDLALAYEGLGDREKARARYREVVRRFPSDPNARNALVREVSLDAHLEDWPALGDGGGRHTETRAGSGERTATAIATSSWKSVRRVPEVDRSPILGHCTSGAGGTLIRESASQEHQPRTP